MGDYYDIDDILAEEDFVPVQFHKAVNGVKIDESSERGFVSSAMVWGKCYVKRREENKMRAHVSLW
ncbi:unnamed protein product [Linum tenue]|uniref:Uncharacterized protein n=1 Tax=Linum tenue TaxID=586396 RepID=A0AAV0K2E7_9ROSI|nr:unnamed protein product [Linum tenue]